MLAPDVQLDDGLRVTKRGDNFPDTGGTLGTPRGVEALLVVPNAHDLKLEKSHRWVHSKVKSGQKHEGLYWHAQTQVLTATHAFEVLAAGWITAHPPTGIVWNNRQADWQVPGWKGDAAFALAKDFPKFKDQLKFAGACSCQRCAPP